MNGYPDIDLGIDWLEEAIKGAEEIAAQGQPVSYQVPTSNLPPLEYEPPEERRRSTAEEQAQGLGEEAWGMLTGEGMPLPLPMAGGVGGIPRWLGGAGGWIRQHPVWTGIGSVAGGAIGGPALYNALFGGGGGGDVPPPGYTPTLAPPRGATAAPPGGGAPTVSDYLAHTEKQRGQPPNITNIGGYNFIQDPVTGQWTPLPFIPSQHG